MRRALVIFLTVLLGLSVPAPASATPTDADPALRWAPIHYQDTDSSDYDADHHSRPYGSARTS